MNIIFFSNYEQSSKYRRPSATLTIRATEVIHHLAPNIKFAFMASGSTGNVKKDYIGMNHL